MAKGDRAARQADRLGRSSETPLVGSLPDFPGILATMMISPRLATPLRALADVLLVEPFEGATMTRSERELIATAVSAGNDCFYCMDSHGAFAEVLLRQEGHDQEAVGGWVDDLKQGSISGLSPKLRALVRVALAVRASGRLLRREEVADCLAAGASDQDVQLAVLIASAFCMYNRMVDGMRARTPADPGAHRDRAEQIVRWGYADPRVSAIPQGAASDRAAAGGSGIPAGRVPA